ncbi:MAG TPA: hypothetical protein VGL86_19880 [Polyangia bacterium]
MAWQDEREVRADLIADMRSVAICRLGAVAGESLVRVAGRARPREELLTAPFSATACLAWAVELYFDDDPKLERDERVVATFLLESEGENGAAVIVPPVPILALVSERLVLDDAVEPLPPVAREWIDEHYSGDWSEARVRLVERRVEPGDRIAVVGWARTEYDDERVRYHAANELVLFADAEGAPLSISDDASLF